jgi:hypothetical protein
VNFADDMAEPFWYTNIAPVFPTKNSVLPSNRTYLSLFFAEPYEVHLERRDTMTYLSPCLRKPGSVRSK